MRTVITSEDKSSLDIAEMRRFAGLFRFLSIRDVVVRYKQTMLGVGWSVVRPAVNIVIFGMLSYLVDRSQSFADKFITVSGGVVFWQLLSTAVTEVSNSLSANANILTKVYFPKMLLPLSSLLVCMIDFMIAFVLFMIVYLFARGLPPAQFFLLPVAIVYGLFFSYGFGLLFATASIRYRDVKFILPFVMQILFYASPIVISSKMVLTGRLPHWLEVIYQLNPFVFIVNLFNYCFTGSFQSLYGQWGTTEMMLAGVSGVLSLIVVIVAVKYFTKFEQSFADYI